MKEIMEYIYTILSNQGRQWKIDGELTYPTFEDMEGLTLAMIKDVKETSYDSIESGGILVRKDGTKIDVFVHLGEIDEKNISI